MLMATDEGRRTMNRAQLLAAEVFSYSYANYQGHLGVNLRFDRLMPRDVATLEKAQRDGWPVERLARKLEVDTDRAEKLLDTLDKARLVVDAENPAESFREGVRQSIQLSLDEGLETAEDVEILVSQICYRAADLAHLLELEGTELARYSRRLRWEPDAEYSDGYFDEEE
jgi:hypothetical protein